MKPSPFEYHSPEATSDVVELLSMYGDEAKPLAGGQSLVPMLSLRLARFEHLVDLNRVEGLDEIRIDGDDLVIGAMARQRAVERSGVVARKSPMLSAALPLIGHFQIRNRGTIGGSIAHADPASELPAVALALDAEMEILGPTGVRRLPAAKFFTGPWSTSLEDNELLTALRFPIWASSAGFAVEEIARRHGDFALVGVACGVESNDGSVTRASVSLFGVGSTPVRATAAEDALIAGEPEVEVATLATSGLEPFTDVHASAGFRKKVAADLVLRALATAKGRASEQ